MKYVNKSLVWIPLPGMQREQIIDEIAMNSAAFLDKGDHVWAATISNQGTLLFCYALRIDKHVHQGREINVWFIKRIPESAGPDAYDCPNDILDMCKIMNPAWRKEIQEKNVSK